MINIFRKTFFLLSVLLLSACSISNDEIVGEYTFLKNDIKETLILVEDFSYQRTIYNSITNEIIFEFTGTWDNDDDSVWFTKFFSSFLSVESYEMYKEVGTDDRLYHATLLMNKTFFGNIYFEVTEFGEVIGKYKKQ